MLYAIVSDIHANESAFRHVLADAKAKGAEAFVCLGDVVGYGPLPEETANLVHATCSAVIAGNHDDAVTGRLDPKDFINLAGDAVERHREALSKTNLAWLRALPYFYEGDGFLAVHGDLTDPQKFYYVQDEADAEVNFHAREFQILFVGHTHTPKLFLTGDSGKVYEMGPTDFAAEDGKRYIVNPGSVGYPREDNGSCQSSYVLYDSVRREVTFHFLPFAVSSVMQRGTNPKRWIGIVVTGLLAIAAVCATFFFSRGNSPVERETVIKVVEADNAALILSQKQLTLTHSMTYVQANLQLDRKADPANLLVDFKTPTGDVLLQKTFTVSGSARQRIKIPGGAVSAHFTVLKQKPGDQPGLVSFAPSAQ